MENINENDIFDDIKQDNTLDLESILKEAQNKEKVEDEVADTSESTIKTTKRDEEALSPLEKMKLEKEAKVQKGLEVKTSDLKSEGPTKNIMYNDDRVNAWKDSINEMDEEIKKREAIVVIKKPENKFEYMQMMVEISMVAFDENGKPYINNKGVDEMGEEVIHEIKYIRIRKEGEEAFDPSAYKEYEDKENDSDESEHDTPEISEEKKKTVQILIDKTGLGTDFMFSDDEKAKIRESETIRVNEVKVIDLAAIKAKRSEKSFQENITQFSSSGSRTTICFPASGFRAQMKGMSYGEYSDVALSMENVTFDQYYKRLSIIYNNMVNISTGPFDSFEDFLKNFAYTDIPLALYGMFVSTEAEEQEIGLKCGSDSCGNSFNWKYNTRSLLRLERCSDVLLDRMSEIASAPASEFDNIKAKSAVMNSKLLELPDSKFIVEMGVASAYEFLYNFVPVLDENTFKTAFGESVSEVYMNNILLLSTVRSVWVPLANGEYTQALGYKDILDALYQIKPNEIQILAAYTQKIQSQNELVFSFGDVTCPHCKHVTKNLDVTMDELVFQTYERLMSTEIDVTNIQDF